MSNNKRKQAAVKRAIKRHGVPDVVLCDNGTDYRPKKQAALSECKGCGRQYDDKENIEAIEATGLCYECVWLQEGIMSEENNDGDKRQTAQL